MAPAVRPTVAFLLASSLVACTAPRDEPAQLQRASVAGTSAADSVLALTGVTLIDGRGGAPVPGATIVIRDGRIAAVGPTGDTPIPRGARTLDLSGHFVMPGLIDMHFHVTTAAMRYRRTAAGELDSTYDRALAERLLRTALAFGITTMRDPGASPTDVAVRLRDDVARGRVIGPRLFTAGRIFNRPDMTEAQIGAAVREDAAARVDYVKVYAGIGPEQVRTTVEEAGRHGLPVIGHLQRTSWTQAARLGVQFITHAANWNADYLPREHRDAYGELGGMRARIAWLEWLDPDAPAIDTMVRVLAERGVSVDPTLVAYHTKFFWRDSIYQRDPDHAIVPEHVESWRVLGMHTADWSQQDFDRVQRVWHKQLALVRRLHEGGVLLTAGSDVASPWVIAGVGLHQELALLASTRLTPLEVLTIATRNGARALGIEDEAGTVEAGKRADLVVLRADPLRDIRNTRSIRHVVLGGVLHEPAALVAAARGEP